MSWLIEIAEEKIIEHRLLKKVFNSHESILLFYHHMDESI